MRDFIRDGAKEYRKDTVRGETEIFRWLFSVIGEALLIVPIILVLLFLGRFIQGFRDENPKEENSQSNWAVIRKEQEDDKQIAVGIHNLIYEDGAERL